MGAWGAGPFENDSAGDFMGDLEEGDDVVALLAAALTEAADADGYLDAPEGDVAVAAAAVVALRLGTRLDHVNDYDREDVGRLVVDAEAVHALAPVAIRALDRVIADDSALRGLWDGTPSAGEFHASVTGIRAALVKED